MYLGFWVVFFSEPMWPIEARCAAIANSYFTVATNRVGIVSNICLRFITEEKVPDNSYVSAPI